MCPCRASTKPFSRFGASHLLDNSAVQFWSSKPSTLESRPETRTLATASRPLGVQLINKLQIRIERQTCLRHPCSIARKNRVAICRGNQTIDSPRDAQQKTTQRHTKSWGTAMKRARLAQLVSSDRRLLNTRHKRWACSTPGAGTPCAAGCTPLPARRGGAAGAPRRPAAGSLRTLQRLTAPKGADVNLGAGKCSTLRRHCLRQARRARASARCALTCASPPAHARARLRHERSPQDASRASGRCRPLQN